MHIPKVLEWPLLMSQQNTTGFSWQIFRDIAVAELTEMVTYETTPACTGEHTNITFSKEPALGSCVFKSFLFKQSFTYSSNMQNETKQFRREVIISIFHLPTSGWTSIIKSHSGAMRP